MRKGKRTFAGVAAGALGLALIPFVAVSSSQAATTIAGTATPVRYSAASGVDANVPAAGIVWEKDDANALAGDPRLFFQGTTSAGGKMFLFDNLTAGTYGGGTPVGISALDDTIITAEAAGNTLGTDDSVVYFKVDKAGRYTGAIANGVDTVTFDFTTAGAPTGVSLTPATQTVLVGATATMSLGLTDIDGNATQPSESSAIAIAQTGAGGTLSRTSVSGVNQANADDTAFALGAVTITDSGIGSGSTTVTATGSGDLLGQSASASITATGTVSDDTVQTMAVTSPTSGVWNNTAAITAKEGPFTAQLRAGTTAVTVSIDDSIYNTGPVGLELKPSAGGSVVVGSESGTNGDPLVVRVTPTAGVVTVDMTLGGASALAGGSITVTQVDVNDNALDGVTNLTITQVVPTIYASGITFTPSGNAVAALGATTSVNFTVDDSLGDPASGQLVSAYRGTASSPDPANLLSFATTDAEGKATVTVTNASTLTAGNPETYTFSVSGFNTGAKLADQLEITYSTDGNITTLSAIANDRTDADLGDNCSTDAAVGCTLDDVALISVPFSGTLDDSTDATWNLTTPAATGTVGNWTVFKITTDPADAATVTVPEGAKVSATEPTSGTTLWSAGSTTASVSADSGGVGYVYVWATAVGTHDVTIAAGGLTVTQKIHVVTDADAAYNIALAPESQRVATGGIATVTLTVTDVFGNPVQTTDDTGNVTVSASGEVLLAGFDTSRPFTTNASGEATVTFIAGNAAGVGTLAATPTTGDAAPAWGTTYTPPTGAPAPVTSAAATVTVGSGPTTQSIIIAGERQNRSIIVDGVTQGLAEGTIVRPWIKFPGETTYSQGVAERSVEIVDAAEEIGEFAWQRRTGKKTYVYFRTQDDAVQSTRVIIPAR